MLAVTCARPTILSSRVERIMYTPYTAQTARRMENLVVPDYYNAYWDYIDKESSSEVTVTELSAFYQDLIITIMGEEGSLTGDLVDEVEDWAFEFEDDSPMDKKRFKDFINRFHAAHARDFFKLVDQDDDGYIGLNEEEGLIAKFLDIAGYYGLGAENLDEDGRDENKIDGYWEKIQAETKTNWASLPHADGLESMNTRAEVFAASTIKIIPVLYSYFQEDKKWRKFCHACINH